MYVYVYIYISTSKKNVAIARPPKNSRHPGFQGQHLSAEGHPQTMREELLKCTGLGGPGNGPGSSGGFLKKMAEKSMVFDGTKTREK